jgi:UrcA family protein
MIKNDSDAVKVDARGLNLNSQQGQEVLYERLEVAAKQVCGETTVHRAGSLKRAMDNRNCFEKVLSKAVDSVGNHGLVDLHKTS